MGFADDLGLVVVAKDEDILVEKTNKAICKICEWMEEA